MFIATVDAQEFLVKSPVPSGRQGRNKVDALEVRVKQLVWAIGHGHLRQQSRVAGQRELTQMLRGRKGARTLSWQFFFPDLRRSGGRHRRLLRFHRPDPIRLAPRLTAVAAIVANKRIRQDAEDDATSCSKSLAFMLSVCLDILIKVQLRLSIVDMLPTHLNRSYFVPDVTRILNQIEEGDVAAASELMPLVYAELRRLAGHRMKKEAAGQTLQPTALVHEAYMRLVGAEDVPEWHSRGHFFAAAAEAMRRILIENARRRQSLKRGGDRGKFEIAEDDAIIDSANVDELLDLDAALTKLNESEPEMAKLVELRYFAGLSVEESAKALGMSPRTVKRNWAFARAWLGRELNPKRES